MIGSGFPDRRHIWLATEPAAMRMTHDGLSALVRNRLGGLVCLPQSAADHAQGHRLRPGRHLDLVQAPGVRFFWGLVQGLPEVRPAVSATGLMAPLMASTSSSQTTQTSPWLPAGPDDDVFRMIPAGVHNPLTLSAHNGTNCPMP